ncbi:MAG: thioredoxin family protein [Chitinophagaceae bacterium]
MSNFKPIKQLRIILFLLTFSLGSLGFSPKKGGIIFEELSMKEALAKAAKENKLIFVDIYAVWCGPCKKLKNESFSNNEVAKYFNENFINLSFDGEKGEGAQLAAMLQLNSYPSMYFITPKGEVLVYTAGFMPADELIKMGKFALSKKVAAKQ